MATLYLSVSETGVNLKTSNSKDDSRVIEFSNNGVSDSLTGAPAPKLFFENLAREISQSQRKYQSISIVTMKLLPEISDTNKLKNIKFEKNLSLLSNCIKSNMRGGDFYGRLAENGFWLCIQGELEEATRAAERIEAKFSEKLKDINTGAQTEFTFSEWIRNCDVNSWIKEIDTQFFSESVGKVSK
jgi:GGDEF domain-containing protein